MKSYIYVNDVDNQNNQKYFRHIHVHFIMDSRVL